MVNIKHGNCLDLKSEIPDASVDLILCDLPYAVTANNDWDIIIPFEPLWKQYNRIMKKNTAILLFGQGVFTVDTILSNRKYFRYSLIWDKKLPAGFLNSRRVL